MITITKTVHRARRLEPTHVRYHVRELEPVRFEPVTYTAILRGRLAPQVAALYATNRSPRDRMRRDSRWRGETCPTVRYTAIDPRWR